MSQQDEYEDARRYLTHLAERRLEMEKATQQSPPSPSLFVQKSDDPPALRMLAGRIAVLEARIESAERGWHEARILASAARTMEVTLRETLTVEREEHARCEGHLNTLLAEARGRADDLQRQLDFLRSGSRFRRIVRSEDQEPDDE